MEHWIADKENDALSSPNMAPDAPKWDLTDLYSGMDDPKIMEDLDQSANSARQLEETYKGNLSDLSGDGLASMIASYETLSDQLGRIASFAQLRAATDRDDPAVSRFQQGIQEKINAITTGLLFVTLEINRLDDQELQKKKDESSNLQHFEPWLRDVRSYRPHQLSDEVERTLHEKSITGRRAWNKLFDETMAGLRFTFQGDDLTATEIFDKLSDSDRMTRQKAGEAVAATLSSNIRLFARITNTLAKDKEIEDNWRHFKRPISSRNLANQVEDEVVDALIEAVRQAYPSTAHRYYAIKAKWLGFDKLEYWDRNAPLPEDKDARHSWDTAKTFVIDAYRGFSPKLASHVEQFFDRQWIDAALKPGKDSGAFCHPTVPSAHPYVLMNYQGRNRDVMTLAHELGHGVHQILAAPRGALMAGTPLTLAETASVFGEQLTFRALLENETDPVARRVLLAGKIEDMINTVVRQIAFCEFERNVHDKRREAELTPDDLGNVWMDVQKESLGPAFNYRDEYRTFWSYIPHFIHVPFYVYAYAFGDCLVNSLYARFVKEPEGFEAKYLAMLGAGGTLRHKELLEPFGLDASDPSFWRQGLGVIEDFIDQLDNELGSTA